jgi:hypothetical protein
MPESYTQWISSAIATPQVKKFVDTKTGLTAEHTEELFASMQIHYEGLQGLQECTPKKKSRAAPAVPAKPSQAPASARAPKRVQTGSHPEDPRSKPTGKKQKIDGESVAASQGQLRGRRIVSKFACSKCKNWIKGDFMYTTMQLDDSSQDVPDLFCSATCVPKGKAQNVRNVSKSDLASRI